MTYQIVLINALEEGPQLSYSCRLPNAYETPACATAILHRLLDTGHADGGKVVVYGTNCRVVYPNDPRGTLGDDGYDMPF